MPPVRIVLSDLGLPRAQVERVQRVWKALQQRSVRAAADRERYAEMFHGARSARLVSDPYGGIREANRATAELLGTPLRELAKKPLAVYIAPEERASFRRDLARSVVAPGIICWQATLCGRGRSPLRARIAVRPAHGPRGLELHWLIREAA